jgi:uncharacterized repeat protein (TIGR01451 family)
MNHGIRFQTRSVLLAVGLAAALLVAVLWLAAPLQPVLAEGAAALDVQKGVAPEYAQPGDVVTYTITLSNSDPVSSVNALVHDPLHDLLSYVPDSANVAPVAGEGLTWTLTVSPATEVALQFQAVVSATATDGTVITNTVTVSSAGGEGQASAALAVDMPPSTQIRIPNKDAVVTEGEVLPIVGYAWDSSVTPPFIVETPVLNAQRVDERSYFVGWTEVVSAEQYLLHESTSPDFGQVESQAISAPTTNLLVSKESGEDGTYYYRVQALKFGVDSSRWSNVVSVQVPWPEGTLAVPAENVALRAISEPLTVEVQIDNGGWQTTTTEAQAWGGWRWSYEWQLPQEQDTQHVIHSRALDQAGNVSAIDSITVTLNNQTYLVYLPFIVRRWPPVPYAPVLDAIQNADQDGSYTVSWSYDPGNPPMTVSTFTLQEDTDPEFGSPQQYVTTGLSRSISGQMPGFYYYRVRGNNAYGPGPWSEVQTASVLPGVPVLNAIDNPSKASSYTVSWSAVAGAESYQLEEATSSDFANPTLVYSGLATSHQVTGKSNGTYYYRVRAVNGAVTGAWSNVVSTAVEAGFFDDFANSASGWPVATYNRGTSPDGPAMKVGYTSSKYQMKVLLDTTSLNNQRMGAVAAPYTNSYTNYDVEVDHIFAKASDQVVDPNWGKGGLIFGANDGYSTIFVVEWHFPIGSASPQCAVYKYTQMSLPTKVVWQAGGQALRDWSYCPGLKAGYDQTNRVRAEVRGNQVTIYINSTKLGTYSDSGLGSHHRVGLETGSWERTPVDSRFDNFRVTPK